MTAGKPENGPAPGGTASDAALSCALERALGGRPPAAGARVGLLGGSFNPAHGGHLDIAKAALDRLALDEVWWLVSPQNPLKPTAGMARLEDRVAQAKAVADDPRIRVTAIEADLGTRYSIDTVRALRQHFPRLHFVWLMGADNLVQLPQWKDWEELFELVAIAVFARPGYSESALAGEPASTYARHRLADSSAADLARAPPPAWVFIHGPLNPLSSTALREGAAEGERS